jgi:hypothetical protein
LFLPITFHASAFYSGTGYAALAVIAAWRFMASASPLGSRPLFDFSTIDTAAPGKG